MFLNIIEKFRTSNCIRLALFDGEFLIGCCSFHKKNYVDHSDLADLNGQSSAYRVVGRRCQAHGDRRGFESRCFLKSIGIFLLKMKTEIIVNR